MTAQTHPPDDAARLRRRPQEAAALGQLASQAFLISA